ncbi:MAG TPA: hypothetical protein VL688_06855 [Verrucomicrobiae bacterium]|nr:hypothetical protein [Verrucomicrobiae bacterium]
MDTHHEYLTQMDQAMEGFTQASRILAAAQKHLNEFKADLLKLNRRSSPGHYEMRRLPDGSVISYFVADGVRANHPDAA